MVTLDTDLVLIADSFELEEEDVEPILSVVQRMEPKGLASRDLKECLTIQLEYDTESLPYLVLSQNILMTLCTSVMIKSNQNYKCDR